jgi:hypothetical protein
MMALDSRPRFHKRRAETTRNLLSQRPEHGRSFSILSCQCAPISGADMPSLFRFLIVVGVLGGLVYGSMFVLAHWFDPKPREITVSVPPDRFSKNR